VNKSSNQKISEVLGIDPIPSAIERVTETKAETVEVKSQTSVAVIDPSKSLEEAIVDEDYAEARENMKKIIDKSTEAIEDLSIVARESESARAYEVLATLLKQAQDANKDLLELAKRRKELNSKDLKGSKQETPVAGAPVNIGHAVFVGSTSELASMIKKAREDAESGKTAPPVIDVTPDNDE
jgi:hypothetical protein